MNANEEHIQEANILPLIHCIRGVQAANILNSPRAVALSVYIIRAFVKMCEDQAANATVLKRLAEFDKTPLIHDSALRDIYQNCVLFWNHHPRR